MTRAVRKLTIGGIGISCVNKYIEVYGFASSIPLISEEVNKQVIE